MYRDGRKGGITVESHRVSTDVFLGSVVHLLAVTSDHVGGAVLEDNLQRAGQDGQIARLVLCREALLETNAWSALARRSAKRGREGSHLVFSAHTGAFGPSVNAHVGVVQVVGHLLPRRSHLHIVHSKRARPSVWPMRAAGVSLGE
jgi:hypothetical protein